MDGRRLSHIIPKFVFQHASTRSPSGYLRTNISPNKRMQDGPKEYLLCAGCEARFSKWERRLSEIFKRHHDNPGQTFAYSKDHSLAALSILWRVLAHARSHPELNHLTFGSDYSRTDLAFEHWKRVLLGDADHPGQFRIFWLWPDHFSSGPPDINRYTFHAVDFDVVASNRRSFSVAHLPGLFLIGALEECERGEFRGLEIAFKNARYLASEKKIAPYWLKDYIEGKMALRKEALSSISPVQSAKIDQAVLDNPEAALRSPLFSSILHDQNLEN